MSLSNQIVRPGLITPGNASYASVVLAHKPVAFYRLNETAGILAHDASGHGNTGTLQGGVRLNQRGMGTGTAAMAFDGSTGYIENTAVTLDLNTSAITLEVWFKLTGSESSECLLISVEAYKCGLGIQSGEIKFWLDGFASPLAKAPTDRQWHHLAGVLTSGGDSTRTVYCDGQAIGTDTSGSTLAVSALRLAHDAGSNYFLGHLAGAALYETGLGLHAIARHFNAGHTTSYVA